MIDKKTGIILIKSDTNILRIEPNVTKDMFLLSSLGKHATIFIDTGKYVSYKCGPVYLQKKLYIIILFFYEQVLGEVHFYPLSGEEKGWDDYSEEKEMNKKNSNDALLKTMLGNPPYNYEWGEIISVFDSKSGASQIIVRYKKNIFA